MNLSLENNFLICLARKIADEKLSGRVQDMLDHPLDWDYILKESYNHGVAPLLYQNLKEMELLRKVPAEHVRDLEAIYYSTAFHNNRMLQETGEVLKAFSDAGINSIIFKGPSLAATVYQNPALRPFSDIDFLIAKNDLIKVIDLLKNMGYSVPRYLLPVEMFTKYHFHLLFIKKDCCQTVIEIHWDLRDNYKYPPMDLQKIWDNARHVEISGSPAKVMATDDLLIYLCSHLERHGYMNRFLHNYHDRVNFIFNRLSSNRLIWFVDINEIIQRVNKDINWVDFAVKTNRWDKDGSVASSLYLTNSLFQTGLDPQILSTLNPPRVSIVERVLYRFITKRSSCRKKRKDYILDFYNNKIVGNFTGFQFHPIRLIELNCKIVILSIMFPLELMYHGIKKFISR